MRWCCALGKGMIIIMKVNLIDLTQEIYTGMPVWGNHQDTFIFQNISHEEAMEKYGLEFSTNNLLISEHGPTHTDAIYETDPNGPKIDEMALDFFYGPAICLDVSHVSPDGYFTEKVLKDALKKSGQTIQEGDIVLLHTGHYNRSYGTDDWLEHHAGLDYDGAKWLAEQGVVNFGVDAATPDNSKDKNYTAHRICREYQITHTENLCNLDKVVNKRFLYFGLPLRIRGGTGSPIRAVAVFID